MLLTLNVFLQCGKLKGGTLMAARKSLTRKSPITKPKTTVKARNPLAQVFGTVLKELRKSPPLSSEEAADRIGIGYPAYRLVESGGATLLPAYSPALVKTFGALDWVRVLQFLVCAQAVAAKEGDPAGMKAKAEEVADHDPELRALVSCLTPVFETQGDDLRSVEPVIEGLGLTGRLLNFLSSGPRRSVAPERFNSLANWISAGPPEIPPLHVDVIARQAQALSAFPVSVPPEKLAAWEKSSAHRFQRIYALVRNFKTLAEDGQQFGWDFLLERRFEAVYILAMGDQDLGYHIQSFIDGLLARRVAALPKSTRDVDERTSEIRNSLTRAVQVRQLSKQQQRDLKRFLTYDPETSQLHGREPGPGEYAMGNAWFYHMIDTEVTIGFLSNFEKRGQKFISISLDTAQTEGFVRAIEDIWAEAVGPSFDRLYQK
ncbi:MAG: helix-turn-helix transcriptional regulator [Candidatus Sulfopaludibacter sp.]|nr:helix-turn-helix transcriptional regulator [Candidatus Sulfopaludibacter sp.]